MDITRSFYDPELKEIARRVMSGYLRLYFETAIRINIEYSAEIVAKTNLMMIELEDEAGISDERLLYLYNGAVSEMNSYFLLNNFVKIPTLFVIDEEKI